MKRIFTLLITIMMLASSMMTCFVPVYADEQGSGDGETTSEVEIFNQEEQEEDEDVTVVAPETSDENLSEEGEEPGDVTQETSDENLSEEDEEELNNDEDELIDQVAGNLEADAAILADKTPTKCDPEIIVRDNYIFLNIGNNKIDSWLIAGCQSNSQAYAELVNQAGTVVATYPLVGVTTSNEYYLDGFYMYTHAGGIEIDLRKLIDDKVLGGTYKLKIYVPGYSTYESKAFNFATLAPRRGEKNELQNKLSQLCSAAPSDVTVSFNEAGDLVIESNTKDWLKNLAKAKGIHTSDENQYEPYTKNPEKNETIGGGYIKIDGVKLENYGELSSIKSSTLTNEVTIYSYDTTNQNIVIPKAVLEANGISHSTGDRHSYELSAEGYTVIFREDTLPLGSSIVGVSVNSSGDLVIDCTDETIKEAFISNLDNETNTDLSYVEISYGNSTAKKFSAADIQTVNGKAVISSNTIKSRFDNRIYGDATVKVKGKGYSPVTSSAFLPYLAIGSNIGSDSQGNLTVVLNLQATVLAGSNDSSNPASWEVLMQVDGSYAAADTSMVDYNDETNGQLKLTVKSLDVQKVKVVSTVAGMTDTLELTVTAEGLRVVAEKQSDTAFVGAQGDKVKKMKADAYIGENKLPEGTLLYKSSDSTIATVSSDGTVTALKPGTVTITAYVANAEDSTVYTVTEYDPDAPLTLNSTSIQIEAGETHQITAAVSGKEVVLSDLTFTSSAKAIAEPDTANPGLIKTYKKGKANITVSLKGSGKEKKAVLAVDVIDKVFKNLSLDLDGQTGTVVLYDDVVGTKKQINATGTDSYDVEIPGIQVVKYVSSDTSVFTVDSKGLLTFKKAGVATITGTVSTNPKNMNPVTATLTVEVYDFTPRLSANEVVLYSNLGYASSFKVVPAHQDSIDPPALTIKEITITGGYEVVEIDTDTYSLVIPDAIKDTVKTRKEVLTVTTNEGPVYNFDFKVTINNKKPSAKYKTSGELNTFTGENTLELMLDKLDGSIESVSADWFDVTWNDPYFYWGEVTLKDPAVKSGEITITFEDYPEPVKTKVSFKVSNKKPTVKLSASSVSVYAPEDGVKTVRVSLLNNKKVEYTDGTVVVNGLGYVDQEFPLAGDFVDIPVDTSSFELTDYMTLSYKGPYDNWAEPIVNKLTVKKITKLPKVSFKKSTIKLNRLYQETVAVPISVSGNNDLGLQINRLIPDDNNPDIAYVSYYRGSDYAFVHLTDRENTADGRYTLTFTPEYVNGSKADPIKLNVDVYSKEAKMSVSVKGSLNPLLTYSSVKAEIKVSNTTANVYNVSIDTDKDPEISDYVMIRPLGSDLLFVELTDEGRLHKFDKNTIEIPVKAELAGGKEVSATIKVKVNKKAPKILATKKVNVFDTTNNDTIVGSIVIFPQEQAMAQDLLITIEKDTGAYEVIVDEIHNDIIICSVKLVDGSKVKAGSTQNVVIKIQWAGDNGDPKYVYTTQKVSITDISKKIKRK